MRINKYLSASGILSRREADRFIMSGRITVDGKAAVPGMKVTGTEDIRIDERKVENTPETVKKVVLAYNKKRGTVCSTVNQGKEKNCITDMIDYPLRVYPVGRLDRDSEGLILLTNDGSLVNRLLKGEFRHEKEYEVTFDREVSDEDIKKMAAGGLELVPGRINKPLSITRKGREGNLLNFVLTEGINREIRRIAEAFGYRVIRLKRIRFSGITLKGLKPGEYRELTEPEVKTLLKGKAEPKRRRQYGQEFL